MKRPLNKDDVWVLLIALVLAFLLPEWVLILLPLLPLLLLWFFLR